MAKSYLPPKPIGDSKKWTFLRWVWDLLAGGKMPLVGSDTVKIEVIANEYHFSAKIPAQSGAGSMTMVYQITKLVLLDDGVTPADYFIVQAWDGTKLSGADVKIAKNYEYRPSVTQETVDGEQLTHAYTDDNNRTTTDASGNEQTEICQPRFAVGYEVKAFQCSNNTPVKDSTKQPPPDSASRIQWIDGTDRKWLAIQM